MKALILAAGVSRRLYPLTYNKPKCLLEINQRPILNYQINALRENGVRDVMIVVGYYREMIMDYLTTNFPDMTFQFCTNHHYFETNTAYSVYLLREEIRETAVLLMNADVIYPRELIRRILHHPHETVLAVDVKPCGREEVKVVEGANNQVIAIGKELIQENSLGEFIGVAKFSRSFNKRFASSLEHLIKAGGKADYFEAAIHPLLEKHDVFYEDVSDLACLEIDFVEDLDKARDLAQSNRYD